MLFTAQQSMNIHSILSGFAMSNTGEQKLLCKGRLQLQQIALSICLQSSIVSPREMQYAEQNGILPFRSVWILKLAYLRFCKLPYVSSPNRPWNSVNISQNLPRGASVGRELPSPWWCTLIKKAGFNRWPEMVLSSTSRMMCMGLNFTYPTISL